MNEWGRVIESAEVLKKGDMESFGRLMNESHESCRDLYEISIRELDMLVEIFRSAGALGSRLTGAGFGGCTVSLVRNEEVQHVLGEAAESYYMGRLGLEDPDLSNILFPCKTVDGANIMEKL